MKIRVWESPTSWFYSGESREIEGVTDIRPLEGGSGNYVIGLGGYTLILPSSCVVEIFNEEETN